MLHKVSPLPTSPFAFFRSTNSSLGIINTSILAPSLCRWDSSLLSPITTLVFRRLRFKSFQVPASTSGPSFIFSFWCIGKEDGTSDVGGGESSRFPRDCRTDLDTRDVPSAEINNSQNICHSGLLIVGVTRCLSTHMEKRFIRWIWDNWKIQPFDFSSLWLRLFHRMRYHNGTADERSTASVPSSSISPIQILLKLCLTLVLLTKILLCHHPLRDFVCTLYTTNGVLHLPYLYLKAPGLDFPNHCFPSHNCHMSILSCTFCMSLVEWVTKPWSPSASVGEEIVSWKHLHFMFTILKMKKQQKVRCWDESSKVTNTAKPIFRCIMTAESSRGIVWSIIVGTLQIIHWSYTFWYSSHYLDQILCIVLMTPIAFASRAGQKSIMTARHFHSPQTLTFWCQIDLFSE